MRPGLFIYLLLIILLTSCSSEQQVNLRTAEKMPTVFLWAWERPEELGYIDTNKVGVAFLAQTLTLEKERVNFVPRRQPLNVPENTYLIAVTRIETFKGDKRPEYSQEQIDRLTGLVKNSLDRPNVRAVQIDFDAVHSERGFYFKLMEQLRKSLPEEIPLTMTSLASWCVGDPWFNKMPVDEAVPMAFVMGADAGAIRSFLANNNDWKEPLCRGSYGISVDEEPLKGLYPGRKRFYFKNSAWTKADIEKLL